MSEAASFTRIGRVRYPRRQSTISSTTDQTTTDTPATATTRPLYVGTGNDVSAAVDALDAPWSSAVAVADTELPDFTPRRRWTSVVLGALGIMALAALVVAVITMAHQSTEPAGPAAVPAPPVTTSAAATTTAVVPSPSAPADRAPPPAFASVTATASTLAPPPAVRPGGPDPKPGVRERLHDLFPRLFPDR
ncbi:hypothetical protein OG976_21575 [Mycobacterium sp. NBC_00419]|uniref:hypothetical protein n=1 Tax=Mycobacterium sp. NBC_00419 TaxID=2975989 RepID=UPI002E1F67DD